jgi:hypothetical protein
MSIRPHGKRSPGEEMDTIQLVVGWLSLGWVGSLLGLAGLVAAVLTYRWTRKRSIFAYRKGGLRLIGGSDSQLPTEVKVLYRGEAITLLSRSMVVLWNAGENSIVAADLATIDRLRIEVSQGCKILSAQVVGVSRPVIQFSCIPSDSGHQATLGFEFLDRHDGAVIEVLHTDQANGLNVAGAIRGLPSGLTNLGNAEPPPRTKVGVYVVLGLLVAAAGFAAAGAFASVETLFWPLTVSERGGEMVGTMFLIRVPAFLLSALLVLQALIVTFLLVRVRYPKPLAAVIGTSSISRVWPSNSLLRIPKK